MCELSVAVALPRVGQCQKLLCCGAFGSELGAIAPVRAPGEMDRECEQKRSNKFSETKPVSYGHGCIQDELACKEGRSMLRPYKETVNRGLQIMRAAGEDLRGVGRIRAAVPGEERARGVASHGVEFLAQNFAAESETLLRIAQGREKQGIKACFAGDLPHHLHQAPEKPRA